MVNNRLVSYETIVYSRLINNRLVSYETTVYSRLVSNRLVSCETAEIGYNVREYHEFLQYLLFITLKITYVRIKLLWFWKDFNPSRGKKIMKICIM